MASRRPGGFTPSQVPRLTCCWKFHSSHFQQQVGWGTWLVHTPQLGEEIPQKGKPPPYPPWPQNYMSTARVWFQLDVFFGGGFICLQWMVQSLNLVWSCVDPFWCHPPPFILRPLCKLVTLRSKPRSDDFKKGFTNWDQKQPMTNMTRRGPRTELTLVKEMLLIIWLSGNTRKKLQGRWLKDKSKDFTRTNYEAVCFG